MKTQAGDANRNADRHSRKRGPIWPCQSSILRISFDQSPGLRHHSIWHHIREFQVSSASSFLNRPTWIPHTSAPLSLKSMYERVSSRDSDGRSSITDWADRVASVRACCIQAVLTESSAMFRGR